MYLVVYHADHGAGHRKGIDPSEQVKPEIPWISIFFLTDKVWRFARSIQIGTVKEKILSA